MNHRSGEYVRDGVTTNSIESVWAVLKRGLHGTYHHASEKHRGLNMPFGVARRNIRKPIPVKVINLQAQAWRTAVSAAGGTVSDARFDLANTMMTDIAARGILLDRLWIFGAENTQSALVDFAAAATTATVVAAPTFLADRGYTFNGTTNYIDLGFNPATQATYYTLNTGFIAAYNQNHGSMLTAGAYNATSQAALFTPYNTGNFYARLNDNATFIGGTVTTGLYIGDRTASASRTNARNGADLGTGTEAAVAIPSYAMAVGALNNAGTYDTFSDSRCAMFAIGGTLGATNRANFARIVNTYLTAIGANTY